MDIRRVVLYAALALVCYSLWMNWQVDYPTQFVQRTSQSVSKRTDNQLLPSMSNENTDDSIPKSVEDSVESSGVVFVKTDVLNLSIDLRQGDIIHASLLAYPESTDHKNKPFTLLQNQLGERYVANSHLFVVDGHDIKNLNFNFSSEQSHYRMHANQDTLTVTLLGHTTDGLSVTKSFVFKKGSYLIDVRYELLNDGEQAWKGYLNTQLLRTSPTEDKSSMFHMGSFTGASYSKPGEHRYKKITFKDMSKHNLDLSSEGGWVAMQQHYFLTAWIPPAETKNRFYTRAIGNDYTIGAVSQPIVVSPSQKQSIASRLYLGPEITQVLKAIAPGLDLTVDYGMLWFLSAFLFSLMKAIFSVVGNWGWSIILVTIAIKLAFYRLSATSYKSMANMRNLQPKLQALRERYGDDKAKMSQATMELYRQEKMNPLGGCLPLVIQLPVFIALYWVLFESVELRQAPFMFWINDLSSPDPYHILPIIMGGTMLIQQRLNPAPPDPVQAKVMMFLPVVFTGLFWNFPSGLVLYWIVNNTLSIMQQWYITRKFGGQNNQKTPTKLVAVK